MNKEIEIDIRSEIGELEGVILHTPGAEVENMTPQNAQRALYSDILNLSIARKEYSQLSGILSKVTKTYQVQDLLIKVLSSNSAKQELVTTICKHEGETDLIDDLLNIPAKELANLLIVGVPLERNNLTNFLSHERFSLPPLYNFYFTRDASISINSKVLISRMANRVRDLECIIMEAIFKHSGVFKTSTVNPLNYNCNDDTTIEGGDVLIAREDILLIGNSTRTTTHGIDFILNCLANLNDERKRYIIVQELPDSPNHSSTSIWFLQCSMLISAWFLNQ